MNESEIIVYGLVVNYTLGFLLYTAGLFKKFEWLSPIPTPIILLGYLILVGNAMWTNLCEQTLPESWVDD